MLRHRSSLERHFTPKASAICFPSVKGRFRSPSVLIYREVRVRTRVPVTKKRPTGVDRLLFYGGPSGVRPAPQAAAAALRALHAALANAHAFTQLRALSGSNPCTGNKKSDQPESIAFLSMVGRQGFGLLRRRPLRRFAPCALRWQTLTRLLSSAPFRVRTRAPVTKKRPTGVDRFLFYGGPSGVRTLDLGIKSPLLCQLS